MGTYASLAIVQTSIYPFTISPVSVDTWQHRGFWNAMGAKRTGLAELCIRSLQNTDAQKRPAPTRSHTLTENV